ncbi:alpha/beta hydrolase family esterase [Microbacterium sp. NPDC091662]|uniref:extracellular catalytic domain type 1 short-chain-length polyhydroxyalkanoate depolymerase n=1 Tax=Microbacterium sp. NPDC091662 TaxID=3364211 RepID=UPI003822D327
MTAPPGAHTRPPRNQSRLAVRAAVVVALSIFLVAPSAAASSTPTGDITDKHIGKLWIVDYQLHVPPTWTADQKMPLVVAIHGCGMTGYGTNSMKDMTQLNTLADKEGFLVLYPNQSRLNNNFGCWNWDSPVNKYRDAGGETTAIAGATQAVMQKYGVDPQRVHVLGGSSGAAAAVNLGVTYPDVFATVTSFAGGPYVRLPKNEVLRDPELSAPSVVKAMGPYARPVPLLIVQGDQDTVVPPSYAGLLARQWLAASDLVDNSSEQYVSTTSPGPRGTMYPSERTTWTLNDSDRTLVELVMVNGQAHTWSTPGGTGRYVDPAGPDMTAIFWEFAGERRRD